MMCIPNDLAGCSLPNQPSCTQSAGRGRRNGPTAPGGYVSMWQAKEGT